MTDSPKTGFALYATARAPTAEEFANWVGWYLSASGAAGMAPNVAIPQLNEKVPGLRSFGTYRRGYAAWDRLMELLPTGRVTDLGLYSMQDPSHPNYISGWFLYGTFSLREPTAGVVEAPQCAERQAVRPSPFISTSRALSLLRACGSLGVWDYALATATPWEAKLEAYLGGIGSKADKRMNEDAAAFLVQTRRECDRKLRNVHAINLLTKHHLELPVGPQTLREWIAAGGGSRGQIEPFDDRLTLWALTEHDPSEPDLWWDSTILRRVRAELEEVGFFPWQQRLAARAARAAQAAKGMQPGDAHRWP